MIPRLTVVSNTSPLINLAQIGMLDLLQKLYGEIYVPDAVWQEVVVKGKGQPGAAELIKFEWVRRQSVTNVQLVQALSQDLDAGEAEAIALALELKAGLLIMDERLGRQTAQHLGVNYTGIIGVLIEAKHQGLISQLKPQLDALRIGAGFWIREEFYRRVLRDENE